jgi:hypothetical protein
MSDKLSLLKKAHELLDDVTPLKFNCGELCGAKCCKKSSTDSTENPGMLLFPQEELLINDDSFTIKESSDGKILICNGTCKRSLRPFSCRIFPFYVSISQDEKLTLKCDPRAFNTCPVSLKKKGTRHSVYFHRNVIRAVRILMQDEDFKRELIKTSDFCDGLYSFYRKMLQER